MKKKPSFDDQLKELELLVEKMDQDELPLEEAIACYEDGIKLSQLLNKLLDDAQQKVELLSAQVSEKKTK